MNRPHLLLAHAALGSASQFDALRKSLCDDFTVHAIDFEGHGEAGPVERDLSTQFLADNVLAYLDYNEIESVDVFGHSMGGYVGLQLAAQAPSRVRAVHTLGTRVYWDPDGASAMCSELNADVIESKVPAFAKVLAARHALIGWKTVVARTSDYISALGANPDITTALLEALEQRIRFGVGDRDHLTSVDMSADAARRTPKGELMVLPRTAHPLESVRIDLLVASIRDFFL
jgi:pimeloyl-ACP methyl ester carboxylesterase